MVAIELEQLIDELEDLLNQATRVPFGGKLLVDEAQALDLIDRIRVAVSDEIKPARRVVAERDRLLNEAQDQVHQTLQKEGLLAAVEAEQARLLAQAQQEAQNIRNGADDYARQVLEELNARLDKLQTSVQKGLQELNKTK